MKKIMSVILCAMLLFGCMALTASAAGAESGAVRYTVLLLDTEQSFRMTSGGKLIYTVDSPIEYIKAAAQKFVDQVQKANGTNYVAVVSYSSSTSVKTDFTTDTKALSTAIDNISMTELWADIDGALLKADELLSAVDDPDAMKNIVILTQGVPAAGRNFTEGKYTEDDCEWYRSDTGIYNYEYANAAYATAESLWEKYDIYSVGLFQKFSEVPEEGKTLLDFARMFARDLQNVRYNEVDDVDDLIFAFDDIAEFITTVETPDAPETPTQPTATTTTTTTTTTTSAATASAASVAQAITTGGAPVAFVAVILVVFGSVAVMAYTSKRKEN